MRPLGIDRLYAWFRPNLEEFGRSVFCVIDCCVRASHAFVHCVKASSTLLQISPNSPEKIHA